MIGNMIPYLKNGPGAKKKGVFVKGSHRLRDNKENRQKITIFKDISTKSKEKKLESVQRGVH